MYKNKIIQAQILAPMIEAEKKQHKKIVFTNGCFDILHVGHVRYLNEAKNFGDKLIVALNTDHSVKKIKGSTRPIIGQSERAEIIAALEFVDYVTFFNEETPYEIIFVLKPNILVKGGDYKPESVIGKDIVESYGGKVVILPFHKGNSTTGIIKKITEL
jgi:D-beta-D-heptose 7-phosphate kinase / D-beta-D-heptose 1-phosphate adenosyltransferase